jgi:two-component system nitrogen regulation sensor histidine kinase GlnL
MPCKDLHGLPYNQLLPRLFYKEHDALDWVLQTGESLVLQEVQLGERLPVQVADLTIEPLLDEGIPSGVRVVVCTQQGAAANSPLPPLARSEELEKLVIMLSHGVRNPLNAIKGAVSYLQSRFAHEPDLEEFTGIMSEEIARLERFIGGFLATSCFDQAVIPLDVNALLKKIALYTSLQARVAGIDMIVNCGVVPPLHANPFQIEQAILNLLNNAIAILPSGGQVRLISRLERREGREFVTLEVADDGPGMSPAKIAALNDPTSGPERGRERGFGLFITREVVQAHGGLMEVVSATGEGTCVRLLLPAALAGNAL